MTTRLNCIVLTLLAIVTFTAPTRADVRTEMAAIQAERAKAFVAKDVGVYMKRYAVDYMGTDLQGETHNRQQVEADTRRLFSIVERFSNVRFEIAALKADRGQVSLTVRQHIAAYTTAKDTAWLTCNVTVQQVWQRAGGRGCSRAPNC